LHRKKVPEWQKQEVRRLRKGQESRSHFGIRRHQNKMLHQEMLSLIEAAKLRGVDLVSY
jgi:hypothetical protein